MGDWEISIRDSGSLGDSRQLVGNVRAPQASPPDDWRMRALSWARLVGALTLIVPAERGVWIGAVDGFLHPMSLASQLVGLSYLLAGVTATVSSFMLILPKKGWWPYAAVY